MAVQLLKRKEGAFSLENAELFIKKALRWANTFPYSTYLTPNDLPYLHGPFQHILATGSAPAFVHQVPGAFEALKDFHAKTRDWLFGYLTYDLKNDIENLTTKHPDSIGFAPICFFQPGHLLFFRGNEVTIQSTEDPESVFKAISSLNTTDSESSSANKTAISPKISPQQYVQTIKQIKEEIVNGEVYELNFCMEFMGNNPVFHPLTAFQKLNQLSPMPFAAFQKFGDKYLLCASPERFLKKSGDNIISQPIKGTISRGKSPLADKNQQARLFHSEKERAENMMIVDLVRNDLAKSAFSGTVKVEELFGIYSYEKIHQMVSTVTAKAKPELSFVDIIRNAFPMGSMTGAPKISAMQLIEHYESSKRGLYSGAAGYITPTGDFDFNVVIRSILYNGSNGNLSFQVGSAITYDALPEQEYEECLLKARAILEVLGG